MDYIEYEQLKQLREYYDLQDNDDNQDDTGLSYDEQKAVSRMMYENQY